MNCYLGIAGSYKNFEMALYTKDKFAFDKVDNFNISENFIIYLDNFMKKNQCSIYDLDFIALDQGPGAFTSLRATIASCNGISFASGIPLIGIDGLNALSKEIADFYSAYIDSLFKVNKNILLVALLNAYNNDVYYSISGLELVNNKHEIRLLEPKSYQNIYEFLSKIVSNYPNYKFVFCGNGAILHKNLILQQLGDRAIFNEEFPAVASAKCIAEIGRSYFIEGNNLSRKLLPLYLKTQNFKPKYT